MVKARDIMTKDIATVKKDAKITEVAKLMQANCVGSIPVCDSRDNLVGIVTDRDIVLRNIAIENDPKKTPVSKIMSKELCFVSPETDIYKVSRLMAEKQIRRIPVVENNKVVGLVSLGDLSKELKFSEEVADTISDICRQTRNS